jgi:hypothetical protein
MHKDCAVLQRYRNCEGCYAHPTKDYEEPLVEGRCENTSGMLGSSASAQVESKPRGLNISLRACYYLEVWRQP